MTRRLPVRIPWDGNNFVPLLLPSNRSGGKTFRTPKTALVCAGVVFHSASTPKYIELIIDRRAGLSGARYKVRVEDSRDETIDVLRKEYGDQLANVERDLMGQAQAEKLP